MSPISDLRYVPSPAADRARGLLGFVSLVLHGELCVDGITVRRTREGRYTVSFPARRDTAGNQHPIVWPLTAAARTAIETAVLAELDRRGFISLATAAERSAS